MSISFQNAKGFLQEVTKKFPLPIQLFTVGVDGEAHEEKRGTGLSIRQHDDVMLASGYSRVTHYDFSLDAGEFAIIVLDMGSAKSHHAESRTVSTYNSDIDVKVIPNYVGGGVPAVVSAMRAFNQKGGYYDPDVDSVFTFRGTNIAVNPLTIGDTTIIDHITLRADTGKGNIASSKDLFASVTGRYYYEGQHVALFENTGAGVAYVTYQYNWHEF